MLHDRLRADLKLAANEPIGKAHVYAFLAQRERCDLGSIGQRSVEGSRKTNGL